MSDPAGAAPNGTVKAESSVHPAAAPVSAARADRRVSRRVVMLLENNPFPGDVRVDHEAETLGRAGYDVHVIAPRAAGQGRRGRHGRVRISRFGMPPLGDSRMALAIEWAIASLQLHVRGSVALLRGAEVLHIHNPPDTLFGLAFLARWLGRRVVFDHHDLAPELYEAKFGPSPLIDLLRGCEHLMFRAAHVVVAANQTHREVALGRGGVSSDAVLIVRNGPRRATLTSQADAREEELKAPLLAFLGSMESQDGVTELPALLRLLEDTHHVQAGLLMIGDGSRRAWVEHELHRLGLGERARFVGQVPHDQVPRLLSEADICVDPAGGSAVNHASTMVKIAEYLAAGRPVVAYRLRETERTAQDAALYADPGDLEGLAALIAALAREPDRRRSVAARARARAEDLVWEHSEPALLDAYARLHP